MADAGVELFNASSPPLETDEAGSVFENGVGYAVGPTLIEMADEELRLDEETTNKFEVACLPMPLLRDDDCGVSSASVELANGSNSYSNQEQFYHCDLMAYQTAFSSCYDAIANDW